MRRKRTTKTATKTITKTLKASQSFDERGRMWRESIHSHPDQAEDGIWVQFFDEFADELGPDDNWDWEHVDPTDFQIHIGGTRKAYEELATILLTFARIKTISPDYHVHLDLHVIHTNGTAHFTVHPPVADPSQQTEFARSRGMHKAWISKDGKTTIDLTPKKRLEAEAREDKDAKAQ